MLIFWNLLQEVIFIHDVFSLSLILFSPDCDNDKKWIHIQCSFKWTRLLFISKGYEKSRIKLSFNDNKKKKKKSHSIHKCTVSFLERLPVPSCIQILFLLGWVHWRHFYDIKGPVYTCLHWSNTAKAVKLQTQFHIALLLYKMSCRKESFIVLFTGKLKKKVRGEIRLDIPIGFLQPPACFILHCFYP